MDVGVACVVWAWLCVVWGRVVGMRVSVCMGVEAETAKGEGEASQAKPLRPGRHNKKDTASGMVVVSILLLERGRWPSSNKRRDGDPWPRPRLGPRCSSEDAADDERMM